MFLNKISLLEWLVLAVTAVLVAIGLYTSITDIAWFEEVYTVEDGIVETITLIPLAITLVLVLYRLIKNWPARSVLYKACQLLLAFFLFFVIGEEISWGMRIFDLELTDFFVRYNKQSETNLHNLEIKGVSINKLIFSRLIVVIAALYFLVLPVLYRKWKSLNQLADAMGIPVPRVYQIIAFILLFVIIGLIPSGKRPEILELGSCFIFMLIVYNPVNRLLLSRAGRNRTGSLAKTT
jgi:hypothetical protein